jgi:hypothetical protein
MLSTEWTRARMQQEGIELVDAWCLHQPDDEVCEWVVVGSPDCKCGCDNDHIHCQHGYIIEVG